MDLEELAVEVNNLISERTRYGVRTEVAERSGVDMIWSNGSACWIVGWRVPAGKELRLDANEVFVPGATKRDLQRLVEEGMLLDLPLYGGSFERRQMGTPDYSRGELPPAIKVVRDLDWPREEAVDEALRKKAEES